MKTKQDIYLMLKNVLIEDFEIEDADISEDANLYTDLDLDSIDAIDLVVKLREITGKKIEADSFKKVRTVNDVINEVDLLVNNS
jgi:acyl carrier protein